MGTVAALSYHGNPFKDRYQALVARGNPSKPALVAVMRKMLVTLNALLRKKGRSMSPE